MFESRARTHTSPAIERSVLLRMGFSGGEARQLVEAFSARNLLGQLYGRGLNVRRQGHVSDFRLRYAF